MDLEALRERIIEETTNYNTDALVRFAISKPVVTSTEEFTAAGPINYTGGVILGTSHGPRIYWSIFIAFGASILLDGCVFKENHFGSPFVLSWLILSVIFFFIIVNLKGLNPEIIIDMNGISPNGDKVAWENIRFTFILNVNGRYHQDFLIIVDNLGHISKYYLYYITPKEIAPIIEYFKHKYKKL